MSLTITTPTSPEGWIPSGNDIIFTALSTSASQSGFAYLIDVYVNGTAVIQLRQSPIDPSQAIRINVGNIVRNFINSVFINGSGWRQVPEIGEVYITVTEYYGGQPYTSKTSVPVRVWNATAQWNDMKRGVDKYIRNFTPYSQGMVHTDGRMLAYHDHCPMNPFGWVMQRMVVIRPEILPKYQINWNVPQYVSFFTKGGYGVTNPFVGWVVLAGFNSDGLMIKKFMYGISNDSTMNKTIFSTSVRMWSDMGTDYSYKYSSDGIQTDDFSDCTYAMLYTTTTTPQLNVTTPDTTSLYPILFEINHCKEAYYILYKSGDGSWGQMLMNKRVENSVNIENTTKLDTAPTTWSDGSRLITTVDLKAQGKWVFNTGWIEGHKYSDVEDLITSKNIYIVHQPDTSVNDTTKIDYIPVQLNDADYVVKEKANVNLRNYQLTFTESFYRNTMIK